MSDASRRQQKAWDQLAEKDPFDAVLTNVRKDSQPEQRFFDSGVATVQEILTGLDSRGIELTFDRAMDFGCGLGRLSSALAESFSQVTGIDHSANMIRQAEQLVDLPNCEFAHSGTGRLADMGLGQFDFVLSLLVLQHVEKPDIPHIISDLVHALNPNGIAVLQLPDSPTWGVTGLRLRLWNLLPRELHVAVRRVAKRGPYMEMNGLSESQVVSIVERSNGRIVDTEWSTRSGWNDRLYYIQKNV